MDQCKHFDGKRCALTGNEPEQTCRPGVSEVVRHARFTVE
jgi:hypothetical protein